MWPIGGCCGVVWYWRIVPCCTCSYTQIFYFHRRCIHIHIGSWPPSCSNISSFLEKKVQIPIRENSAPPCNIFSSPAKLQPHSQNQQRSLKGEFKYISPYLLVLLYMFPPPSPPPPKKHPPHISYDEAIPPPAPELVLE